MMSIVGNSNNFLLQNANCAQVEISCLGLILMFIHGNDPVPIVEDFGSRYYDVTVYILLYQPSSFFYRRK